MCAGFLSRGADHNLTVRLAYARGDLVQLERSGDLPLYEDYRAMAVANGVECDDPSLSSCRGPQVGLPDKVEVDGGLSR